MLAGQAEGQRDVPVMLLSSPHSPPSVKATTGWGAKAAALSPSPPPAPRTCAHEHTGAHRHSRSAHVHGRARALTPTQRMHTRVEPCELPSAAAAESLAEKGQQSPLGRTDPRPSGPDTRSVVCPPQAWGRDPVCSEASPGPSAPGVWKQPVFGRPHGNSECECSHGHVSAARGLWAGGVCWGATSG